MANDNYRSLNLDINNKKDSETLLLISRALSNKDRINILKLLNEGPLNIVEISKRLNIPVSTTAHHIQILEEAKLTMTEYTPTLKGHMKLCSRMIPSFEVNIWNKNKKIEENELKIEMPVGQFVDAEVSAPCGMAGLEGHCIEVDQPYSFYSPSRFNAQLIWFQKGYVSYRFPIGNISKSSIKEVSLTLELCSETAYYKEEWPSDITFYFNNKEALTYISSGDYGKDKGMLNPSWWSRGDTQHGMLIEIKINNLGIFLDNKLVNESFNINSIKNDKSDYFELKIAVKSTSNHVGGINIFGKHFGNHPQDIVLKILY